MSRFEKILVKLLEGNSDNNFDFGEIVSLLTKLGFSLRIKGSHHVFTRSGIEEILNLQPEGHTAKPYQVRQVRALILKYKITAEYGDRS